MNKFSDTTMEYTRANIIDFLIEYVESGEAVKAEVNIPGRKNDVCRYRIGEKPDGNACFLGMLFADDCYDPEMEDASDWGSAYEYLPEGHGLRDFSEKNGSHAKSRPIRGAEYRNRARASRPRAKFNRERSFPLENMGPASARNSRRH